MTINPSALWLRWRWVALVVVGVVALLLMDRCSRRRTDEEVGKWREITKRLQADSAAKAGEITRVDSVFVRDTVRFATTRTRYQTLRDSVLVTKTDTLLVERVVNAADSTIRACQEVITSCSARVAARDSLIRVLGDQRQADQRLSAALLRRATPRIAPFVEVGVDPFDIAVTQARAGVQLRVLGPFSLTGAVAYQSIDNHRLTGFAGVRVTF